MNIPRKLTSPAVVFGLAAILVAGIVLLTLAAQNSEFFSGWYTALLVFNLAGVVLLGLLFLFNLLRLIGQVRRRELGSRLTLRFVLLFSLLALLPIGALYYFAVQFLSRGIDSWFDQQIEQSLNDALLLGRNVLEASKQDLLDKVRLDAARLSPAMDFEEEVRILQDLLQQRRYSEVTLFDAYGRIIASAAAEEGRLVPETPEKHLIREAAEGGTVANLEPMAGEGLRFRVLAPVYPRQINSQMRVLQILQPLPLRFSRLGASIQQASVEYEKLQYLRRPLKLTFVLALTLITLMTTLLTLWLALYSSRRLVAPLKELAAGTRAVAAGDYQTRLQVESKDELGLLVRSFNDMIGEIRRAQDQAQRNQRLAEEQKSYLQTVLSNLLSGVLSFDREGRLLTYNAAAEQILQADLEASVGRPCDQACPEEEWTHPFFQAISAAMAHELPEWRQEITLTGPEGYQVLVQRGGRLGSGKGAREGCVVVFDDVTDLIHAQRNAAWGEVARRLAHEIKNPLTPIQLSAERIRRKYLGKVDGKDRETLDRATRTIAQQVESMKRMVNAFSNYAQPMKMKPAEVDFNQLIQDVVELHRHEKSGLEYRLELDPELPGIKADADRLRQVLNNLLLNTRDAAAGMPAPRATLRTRPCILGGQSAVELVIEDNGPGFPENLIERIFEPYVTTKEKGTGLGLAIVKRIVEEHGGVIRAGNAESGGGRITIRLPLEKHETGRTDAAHKEETET